MTVSPSSLPIVQLRSGREKPLEWKHPWVFSGAVDKVDPGVKEGDLVSVLDSKGKVRGRAFYGARTIALKFLTDRDELIDQAFFERRLRSARQMRELMGLFALADTNCFRLFFGDNDGIPGLIIDRYARTAVMQLQERGLLLFLDQISAAMQTVYGDQIKNLYLKEEEGRYCFGERQDEEVYESGIRYAVDWEGGQKTGFFLDQRDNRKLLRTLANGKKVLNCFCYTGGFSLSALAGGATSVTSVDSSAPALELLAKNVDYLNAQGSYGVSKVERADVFDFLETAENDFEIILIDPPAFVKHRDAIAKGIRGYRQLNKQAIEKVKTPGLVLTFSCSQLVSRQQFRELVFEASIQSGRRVSICGELHQASCHPVAISFPEGEYLKGLVLQVDD